MTALRGRYPASDFEGYTELAASGFIGKPVVEADIGVELGTITKAWVEGNWIVYEFDVEDPPLVQLLGHTVQP